MRELYKGGGGGGAGRAGAKFPWNDSLGCGGGGLDGYCWGCLAP